MAHQKMIGSNPISSNPTHVAFVVHPISLWGEEMHVMSFRVRRNIFPIFEQTRQNWHEMTRAGVVQKAPDTSLRGAYLTPVCLRGAYWTPLPTDTTRQWHAMTRMFFLIFSKKLTPGTRLQNNITCYTRFETESCDDAQIELLQAHGLPVRFLTSWYDLKPSASTSYKLVEFSKWAQRISPTARKQWPRNFCKNMVHAMAYLLISAVIECPTHCASHHAHNFIRTTLYAYVLYIPGHIITPHHTTSYQIISIWRAQRLDDDGLISIHCLKKSGS